MSFICQYCKKCSKPREKMRLVTTRIRNVNYPDGFRGTEIVSEKRCCESCWLNGEHSTDFEYHQSETNRDGGFTSIRLPMEYP